MILLSYIYYWYDILIIVLQILTSHTPNKCVEIST